MMTQTQCKACIITTAEPAADQTATHRLDDAVNRIDLVRADINAVIRTLPDDTPMFAIVDITNALWNLRNASVLLDKANDTIESAAAEVVR